MVDHLDLVKRLEDAGAAAITMHSLFEEQITREQLGMVYHMELLDHGSSEALSYFPQAGEFRLGPYQYLEQIRLVKQTVNLPGHRLAQRHDPGRLAGVREAHPAGRRGRPRAERLSRRRRSPRNGRGRRAPRGRHRAGGEGVGDACPIAVKLSPFYSSVAHLASQLDALGVEGMVLFNRFYQPDFDLQDLAVTASLSLSSSNDLLLRLRWLAVLFGRVKATLAVTGGVHTPVDALKAVMAGASGVQVVSGLLKNGPEHIKSLVDGMRAWLEEHEYDSLKQAMGSMSLERSPNPAAFERANYMKVLAAYQMQIG